MKLTIVECLESQRELLPEMYTDTRLIPIQWRRNML